VHPVPRDTRAQLAEGGARIAARQHVQNRVIQVRCESVIRVGVAHQVEQGRHVPILNADHSHHLLGQHVEAVLRGVAGLHVALNHRPGDGRQFEQVLAVGREQAPHAGLPHQVSRAPHPLQAAGHPLGRLELHYQVHGADVDAQLQRRGTHQGRQSPLLQSLLQAQSCLAADASMVGAEGPAHRACTLEAGGFDNTPLGQCLRAVGPARLASQVEVVQPVRRPLRLPAAVGKDERRAVCLDQVHHLRDDGRPDAATRQLGEILHRGDDLQVHLLDHARVHNRHRPGHQVLLLGLQASQKACHLVQWPLRRRQADALDRPARQFHDSLQRHGQVYTSLVPHQRVDLIHDGRANRAEHVAGHRAGQDQVERLWSGDQDVGWVLDHPPPHRLGRVARAHQDVQPRQRRALLFRHPADAGQRCPQVPLHIVVQRLQRRNVEQSNALVLGLVVVRGLCVLNLTVELVNAPQKGGKRFAGPGGRQDQCMVATLDRRPALYLGARRRVECLAEPALHRR
jgi:hypothetical protein